MTPRALAPAVLLAALLMPATAPALSLPDNTDCLTWTDPKGDSAALLTSQTSAATNDPDLDIVGVRLDSDGTDLLMQIKVADLNATGMPKGGAGERFVLRYVVAGKTALLTMSRDASANTKTVTWTIDAAAKTPKPTVTYDDKADTVSAVIALADLREVTGAVAGDRVAGLYADAKSFVPVPAAGSLQAQWDLAPAPDFYAYTLGSACGQEQVDMPLGTPDLDCNILLDPKGDGVPGLEPPAEFENDPDLDIRDVVGRTTKDDVLVYVKLDKLAALPTRGQGHAFEVGFTFNGKLFSADAAELNSTSSQVFTGKPRVYLGTTLKTDNVPIRVRFDRTQSMIVFALDRHALGNLAGEPLTSGAQLTSLYADSYIVMGSGWWPADEAPNTKSADVLYAVGDNRCFPPPPAKLAPLSAVTTQFGDAATVSAKLLDSTGDPLAGKRVKFTVGTDSVTYTTDSAGVARGPLTTAKTAGAHTMAVAFAGDSSASKVSGTTPFTVTIEATRLTLGVVKSGTSRVVTATLKDNDGKALAGQKVDWLINGKRVATATTDAAGRIVLRSAKPTNLVGAKYLGVAGKYAGSSLSVRV